MTKKIIKPKEKEPNPFMLSGEKALLVAEGCKLDKQKKDIEKRLTEIKKALDFKKAGEYSNSAGDRIVVSIRDNYTNIVPKELYSTMKKKKLGKFFWGSVKVALTEAKKYLTEKEIDSLRKKLDPIKIYSFK
jgi:tetrahydromethanopterin S-methyltransferase subunit G